MNFSKTSSKLIRKYLTHFRTVGIVHLVPESGRKRFGLRRNQTEGERGAEE
jgi:hypothetical protein